MQRVFQTFADRIAESREPEAFRIAMADTAAAMELPCFAYLRLPRDGRSLAALISTYPVPWTDHYLKEHYERLDPVILSAHERSEPFHWGLGSGDLTISRRQERFFDEASAFGINCGFTIPIHDGRGPLAAVTFASDIRRPTFEHTVKANARVLQLMAATLHAHVRRKLWLDPTINGVRLSPRERECLTWVAKGKSAWAIGEILGISRRTASFHLDNARAKLGVQTLKQAIALLAAAQTPKS